MTTPAEKIVTLRFCISSIARLLAVAFMMLVLGVGCGVRDKSGKCKDYEPVNFCDDETVYICETTDDGCRQCGCVPVRNQAD